MNPTLNSKRVRARVFDGLGICGTALLGGRQWADVLIEALGRESAIEPVSPIWSDVHTPMLVHPLSSVFPESADMLNLDCVAVGGDGDTVFATAFNAGHGLHAVYSSLARYAFDLGAWKNCEWIAFLGVSGHPGDRHWSDQNRAWGPLEMVPILYDWHEIRAVGSYCSMLAERAL